MKNSKTQELPDDIQKLRARDPVYLAELFETLNPRFFRLMAGKGLFAETAEEIIHECWDTFFASLDQFQGRSRISTFLFGILINKIREHRRRMNRTDFSEDSEQVYSRSFTPGGWWAQDPVDPYRLMANRQLGKLIEGCLEGLTDSQRAAFLLIESEGESSEEACQIMGVTPTHLRVLIFRAKDKLRACLEGQSFKEIRNV